MNLLLIVAHEDEPGSHNRYMFERVKENFAHTEYKVIDLYEEDFEAALGRGDREQVERYQNLLAWSTHVVVIYPVWWNGMPAILKGFCDKIIEPGFAFVYDDTFIPKVGWPRGLLRGRKAAFLTTSGSPSILQKVYQRGRAIKQGTVDTFGFAGLHTKNFHLGGAQALTESNKRRIESLVEKATNWLTS